MAERDDFREGVFARDGHRCVACGEDAVDAHHIIERRLWPDGGYILDNGASLCSYCHMEAEQTVLSPETLREQAGITRVILPPHMYEDAEYTKWGDQVLADGTRLPGELFHDESVQKVLKSSKMLHLYRTWIKHPRTHHLPWSECVSSDDKIIMDLSLLMSGPIVVTTKMDGEQTTMYRDHIHARSVDGGGHPSRDWVKNLWSQISFNIPPGWRVCGENLYAQHSIPYSDLPSWFMVHSIWNEMNVCLSWEDTLEWAQLLGLEVVPTVYSGPWDEAAIKACWTPGDWETMEGYVVRSSCEFPFSEFRYRVAKFVRPNHVQTTKHWMHGQPLVVNR